MSFVKKEQPKTQKNATSEQKTGAEQSTDMLQNSLYNIYEGKQVAYSKADVIKLNTKCLYAGKLERINAWNEKPHNHPFCEILYVFSGAGRVVAGDKEYEVRAGDIIVYNPYVVHSESTLSTTGLELGFFGITNFQVCNLPFDCLIEKDASPVLHTGKAQGIFDFYFKSLIEEVREPQHYSDLMTKYWARMILIEILRVADISEAKFVTNAIFTRIYQYVTNNFAEIESMDRICDELKISKYYLSHVFKNYMGVPPMQYITAQKISYAKRLLQETDMTATAIGEACGYRDHVLFFKNFKKLEGVTPIEFRRRTSGPELIRSENESAVNATTQEKMI